MRRRMAQIRTSLRDSQDERRSASWAYVGDDITVFGIADGRGYTHAQAVPRRRLCRHVKNARPTASSPPRPTRRASPLWGARGYAEAPERSARSALPGPACGGSRFA